MSPFLLIGLLAAGAYVVSSKPKTKPVPKLDCGCGKFRPIFKLSKDCTQILGLDDIYLNNPKAIRTDHNKIHSYINSKKKDFDIWKAVEDILIQRYGEKCYKASESVGLFLFVMQFLDIAKVLFLYDHIDCWNYDQLIFGDLWHWLKDKQLLTKYEDGKNILLYNDLKPDQALREEVALVFNWYPNSSKKASECLAIDFYIRMYLTDKYMHDYVLATAESEERWKRMIRLVEETKKGNKK